MMVAEDEESKLTATTVSLNLEITGVFRFCSLFEPARVHWPNCLESSAETAGDALAGPCRSIDGPSPRFACRLSLESEDLVQFENHAEKKLPASRGRAANRGPLVQSAPCLFRFRRPLHLCRLRLAWTLSTLAVRLWSAGRRTIQDGVFDRLTGPRSLRESREERQSGIMARDWFGPRCGRSVG